MKVAVATLNDQVSEHFGHCQGFTFATVDADGIKDKEYMDNPGGHCAVLPDFLGSKGVETLVVGGIGGGAIQNMQARGIQVIGSISGSVDAVLEELSKGALVGGEVGCNHDHDHDDHDCHH